VIAKSTAIKGRGGKSGGPAAKAVGLTSGYLRRVRARGASFKATEQPIDTGTAAGKCPRAPQPRGRDHLHPRGGRP
jgi:hypothetical protein